MTTYKVLVPQHDPVATAPGSVFVDPQCLLKIAIVPDDLPVEQHVLYARAGADVVHNQVVLVRLGREVGKYSNVLDTIAKLPGHDISGQVIGAIIGDRVRLPLAIEVGREVQDPAMIDVGIRSLRAPFFWILVPRELHVFVNFLLQINTRLAKSANHHIRADAGIVRDIAIGIVKLDVRRIVTGGNVALLNRAIYELLELR